MSEINTVTKVIQELIPEFAKYFNLSEQEITEFITNHLENSEVIQELLSENPKINFDDTKDDRK